MSSPTSQTKSGTLRDFIKNIRACKTAAEERALVKQEQSHIRNQFAQQINESQARNMAKLIFMNLMGFETDFGQVNCLNLLSVKTYSQKRIGYLGLTQLFNEKSDVLILATHRITTDLQSKNIYVIATALASLSEICTADMCRGVSHDVAILILDGPSIYIKKKAILAAIRIIRKCPELIDQYVPKIDSLINDNSNAILISTLYLCEEILYHQPNLCDKFRQYIPIVTKQLKALLTNYNTEYDISGVSDPFLQVEILNFLRVTAANDKKSSEEISDILASVVTNTTSKKNAGNAILYENARTIFGIQSANTLKLLAINILGRFLSIDKDQNSKYVSLQTLQKIVVYDVEAVQKHKPMIIECIVEEQEEKQIKIMALDLIQTIANPSNATEIIKELLNILINNEENIIQDLTSKICIITERHISDVKYYIDTMIKVLSMAGNYVKEKSIFQLVTCIQKNPNLQSYSIFKLYYALKINQNQEGLAYICFWCIGEYGQLLLEKQEDFEEITSIQIIDLMEEILLNNGTQEIIKEVGLNSLMKLYCKNKFLSQQLRIQGLIDYHTENLSVEIQQRACEYLKIIECSDWGPERFQLFDRMPTFQKQANQFKMNEIQQKPQNEVNLINDVQIENKQQSNNDLLFDDILDLEKNEKKDLQIKENQEKKQVDKKNDNLLDDLLDADNFTDFTQINSKEITIQALQDENISIEFKCLKENSKHDVTKISANFINKTQKQINSIIFQIAVLKYLILNMDPLNGPNSLQPLSNGQLIQTFQIKNSMQGQKGIVMKIKLQYEINGNIINRETTISNAIPNEF